MPVNSTHPDYDANAAAWLRARDVLAGEDAVKAAGERYLPKLESQTDDEYSAYRARASFYNATARSAEGFLGLVFRRLPFIKLPGRGDGRVSGVTPDTARATRALPGTGSSLGRALQSFQSDVDLMGTHLVAYAKTIVSEVIAVGRAGSLVDWEDAEGRAYVSRYAAEDILNWRLERINGRRVLSLVALRENVEGPSRAGQDEFEVESVEQIRVLKLGHLTPALSPKGGEGDGPRSDERSHGLVVEVWREVRDKKRRKSEWKLIERKVPMRLGKPLPLIPFVFHGPRHALPHVDKLPLGDVITVNLDHYRLDADYKHGMHFTALPTAWVSGFDKSATLRIGASTAWVTETPGATAGFLEYTGQGLTTFERAMDRDERLMAVLGARLLESQKRVGETAEAIELRQTGENSILAHLAQSVSTSLTQVLQWAYWWHSTEDSPEDVSADQAMIELNTDFSTKGLTAQELTAVVQAWQAGAISRESMMDLLRRGEILPEGRSNEEEARLTALTAG